MERTLIKKRTHFRNITDNYGFKSLGKFNQNLLGYVSAKWWITEGELGRYTGLICFQQLVKIFAWEPLRAPMATGPLLDTGHPWTKSWIRAWAGKWVVLFLISWTCQQNVTYSEWRGSSDDSGPYKFKLAFINLSRFKPVITTGWHKFNFSRFFPSLHRSTL